MLSEVNEYCTYIKRDGQTEVIKTRREVRKYWKVEKY